MKAKALLTISTLTGIVPLVIGSFIFWAYFFNPNHTLEIWGILTIVVSAPLCFTGLILTAIFESKNKGNPALKKKSTRNFLLILLNIPFCIFYLWFASYLMDTERITIINNTDHVITDIHVFGAGDDDFISGIEKGESRTIWVHLTSEGAIQMIYKENDLAIQRIIDPYPIGGHRYDYPILRTKEEGIGF